RLTFLGTNRLKITKQKPMRLPCSCVAGKIKKESQIYPVPLSQPHFNRSNFYSCRGSPSLPEIL
ncbi:MAG: hypothetical protein NZ937_09920, partial [Armatimonadetes bacterium]|nr:hypothetical protein [Armatimonadota bacterium]